MGWPELLVPALIVLVGFWVIVGVGYIVWKAMFDAPPIDEFDFTRIDQDWGDGDKE